MVSRYLMTIVLIFSTTLGIAQGTRTLTVEEAVQIGLENSKMLRQSQSRVAYADARSSEVYASALPSLKLGMNYTRYSEVPPFAVGPFPPLIPTQILLSPTILNYYTGRVTLQHPLFVGFRLDAAKSAADWTAEATSQDYTKDKSDLVYNVKTAYWNLFRAREFKKLADETVEQIKSHLLDVKNMMDQGLATNNDYLAAEVQLSNAQLQQIDATNSVRLATVGLDNTLGIPLNTEVEIASEIAHNPQAFASIDTLIQTGIEARPEIKGMDARVRASEAGVTSAKSGWWPQIYLTANYLSARPNQRVLPTIDLFKETWELGVTLSMDIWNWRTTVHQTDEAQAQLLQAREALGQTKDGVTLDITQAYLTLKQAGERIVVAKQGLARAEENHRVTNRRYKEGLVINSDVLDAQFALNQAKTIYTQSLVDFELAQARLAKTIGQ